MQFYFSTAPLEQLNLKAGLLSPEAGGFAAFEGWVRNHNQGQKVQALEYEAAEELALLEARKILTEAERLFGIIDINCVHRVGHLFVGEMAVWVGVSAVHRADAFRACRYVIDELKKRLPIWKKEFYATGDSGWVGCEQCAGHSHGTEDAYYEKQICLPEVGRTGQQKLKESAVLVIGAGGLGSPVLSYLTAAGVGTLGICEYDSLEASNLNRQTLYGHEDVGVPKSSLAAQRLKQANPFIKINIHEGRLYRKNISEIAAAYDILVDCTDNFETKFLLNDYAVQNKKILVQASLYQMEGQLRVYHSGQSSSCLRCLWPQEPEPGCIGNCADAGILGAVAGIFGSLQAMETIKIILGLPEALDNQTLIFDLTSYEIHKVRSVADPSCPACGTEKKAFVSISQQPALQARQVDLDTLSWEEFNNFDLIDVREPSESMQKPVQAKHVMFYPVSLFKSGACTLDPKKRYLLFCEKGIRSKHMADELVRQGYKNTFFLPYGSSRINEYLLKNNRTIFSRAE